MDFQLPELDLGIIPDTSNALEASPDNGLTNPFLNTIPEQDRPIVSKYVNQWDSNVTKRFQELHDTYAPYKELGALDELQQYVELVNILRSDPKAFHTQLTEMLGLLDSEGIDMDQELLDEAGDQSAIIPPVRDLQGQNQADHKDTVIADLQKAITDLTSRFDGQSKAQVESQQLAELDNMMKNMHNVHGEFDDDWVLLQMSKGKSPDDSIKSWNEKLDASVNSRRKATPPTLMSGAGSIPNGQVDPSKFSPAERKAFIAATLEAAANQ